MHTITMNINNDPLAEKVNWFLEHLKSDGLEIISKKDIEDLKLLKSTKDEESISFETFINDGI